EGDRPVNGTTVFDAPERRQLTVLFCDLVGSTELTSQLDPEDMADLIRAFQGAVATAVGRFEGHIAKWMGDAAMVYFGYPRAHEDDAERAARAGLASIVVSEATRRLLGETFELKPLGPQALAGFESPMPAWRIASEREN